MARRAGEVRLGQSIGLETRDGKFRRLIDKGSQLPVSRTEIFTTAEDGQPDIKIRLFGGDHRRAAKNACIGVYELSGFPPGPPLRPQIAVTFSIGLDGVLQVTARDAISGAEVPVTASMITTSAVDGRGRMPR